MANSWVPNSKFGALNKGLLVDKPDMRPDSGGERINGANGLLRDSKGQSVGLWINDISADFSMVGSTAQSKKKRSFYPHNFAQPMLVIAGQTPNQFQHARLAEFIRRSQLAATLNDLNVLHLTVLAGGEKTARNITRGRHIGIDVKGYIDRGSRTAEVGVQAPPFSFNFIITEANKLLGMDDEPVRKLQFKSIMDVVTNPGEYIFEDGEYKPPKTGGGKNNGGNNNGNQGGNNNRPARDDNPDLWGD